MIVTWFFFVVYGSVVCGDKRLEYMLMDGQYIGHVYDAISVDSAIKCCAVCTSNTKCAAVSFNNHSHACELNDHNPYDYPEAEVSSSTVWTSFQINIGKYSS